MNDYSDDAVAQSGAESGGAASSGECAIRAVDDAAVSRAREAVASADVSQASALFSALGDPTRLTILTALAVEPLCVCDLASLTGVTQSCVSHQLRLLRELRLVAFTRDGKRAVYRLADAHVHALLSQASEHVAEERGTSS